MIYEKRVVGATIWGVIFGFISWGLAIIFGGIPAGGAASIIIYRSIMGFTIGISAWKIPWWLHGILIGLIFGIPSGFTALWTGLGGGGFVVSLVTGIVFGFLIELLTTVIFKAEMRVPEPEKKEEKEEKEEGAESQG